MSNYVPPMQLPINSELFSRKQKELKNLIGNLSLNDVKEDTSFAQTTKRIKNTILLKPVDFEDPKIIGNHQIEKTVPPNFQNMWGGQRQIEVVTVEFRFNGSPELFEYSPNGLTFGSSSNMRAFQPYGANSLSIEVELQKLDKTAAINKAKAQMEMTFGLIKGNNKQAQEWNKSIEPTIDNILKEKRKEIIELYS